LSNALLALQEDNRQKAYLVILRDQLVDELEKEVDRLCLEFLVRQQPVAGHLRFVYSTIKINQELERIGDYAESIARQVLKVIPVTVPAIKQRMADIANVSIPMLHDAVRAFLTQDVALARKTMVIEDTVDQIRNQINAELLQLREANRIPLESLTPLMTIARRYERVSDQAKNICEEVIYLCTGEYAKHQGTDQFRVLFVEENNSCLSQIAEGLGNSLAIDKFIFTSAGLKTAPIDPAALQFMKEKGVDISAYQPKTLEHIPNLEYYQVVVVFDRQLNRSLSALSSKTLVFDWSLPTPCTGENEAAKRAALENSYKYLDTHIRDLVQAILGSEIEPSKTI
jgi:phosphate transport system protein